MFTEILSITENTTYKLGFPPYKSKSFWFNDIS